MPTASGAVLGSTEPSSPQQAQTTRPILLADASWYGTLASARDIGGRGVPVVLASDMPFAPARWSRHVARNVRCPPTRQQARFGEWLAAFGEREPGHAYYPTSDDTAWVASSHREALSKHFALYSPPLSALARILDKYELATHGRAAGLDMPETFCPRSEAELEQLIPQLRFPVFMKARSQFIDVNDKKGARVPDAGDLRRRWKHWLATAVVSPEARGVVEGLEFPVIQSFAGATERIYTVDGFCDPTGEIFVTMGCVKILQRPRGNGPGIIFSGAPVPAEIHEGLRKLCLSTGFHGMFDAEFAESEGRKLFIDFNPRVYNHIAFEVERGMPLPWMAYLGATGQVDELRRVAQAAAHMAHSDRVYIHKMSVKILMWGQRLSGGMTREERARWLAWMDAQGAAVTDPSRTPDDPLPVRMERLLELSAFARHPRSYLRTLGKKGGGTPPAVQPRPVKTPS